MITPAEALARLGHAGIRWTNFSGGSGERSPLVDRRSFRQVSRPAGRGHRARALARARRRLLHRARVWHGRSAGQDVSGRHQCPQRAGRSPRARADSPIILLLAREQALVPVVCDRPRYAASFRRIRPALRPCSRGRRLQGLPFQGASLDPPALFFRPAPALRRRDHDHRVAQSTL